MRNIQEFSAYCQGDNWTPAVQQAIREKVDGIFFPEGEYHFCRSGAEVRYCFVTNNDEGLKNLIFNVEERDSFVICGQNARFIFHDRVVPFRFEKVKNLQLMGFSMDFAVSPVIEAVVADRGEDWVSLRFPEDRPYWIIDGKICFINDEYKFINKTFGYTVFDVEKGEMAAGRNGGTFSYRAEEIEPQLVKLGLLYGDVKAGETVVFKPEPRLAPGIILDACRGVQLTDINIYCASGMGVIAQNSFDIDLLRVNVGLRPGSKRLISVSDDATHFANCGGRITIKHCRFERQWDDAVNIHGVYRNLFYNRVGEQVDWYLKTEQFQQLGVDFAEDGEHLLISGKIYTIKKIYNGKQNSVLITNEPLDTATQYRASVLNCDRQPDVEIRNCVFTGNKPRGVLISTGGHVVVEENYFHTPGAAIFIPGDAEFWYEAGPVRDVLIRDNEFDNCFYQGFCTSTSAVICTHPRVPDHIPGTFYHRNIRIVDNRFRDNHGRLINALLTDELLISGNSWKKDDTYSAQAPGEHIILNDCGKVITENNDF